MNGIIIKTPEEIEKMRELGKLVAEALDYIGQFVKPGVTTDEIDKLVYDYHVNVQGGYPAPCTTATRPTPNPAAPPSTTSSATAFPTTSRSKKATLSTSTSPSKKTASTATPAVCLPSAKSPPSPNA